MRKIVRSIIYLIFLLCVDSFAVTFAQSSPSYKTTDQINEQSYINSDFISDGIKFNSQKTTALPTVVEISKIPALQIKIAPEPEVPANYFSKEWLAVYISAGLTLITLALAYYTFQLWNSTNQVVLDARDTAQKQLRAYVSIMGVSLSPENPRGPGDTDPNFPAYFNLALKNWGQTPAHNMSVQVNFHSVERNQPLPNDFGYPEKNRQRADGRTLNKKGRLTLAPGNSVTQTLRLNQDELAAYTMSAQHLSDLYIYGWVKYNDIFSIERESKFCFLVGHHAHGNFSPLTNYHEHNEET